MKVTYALATVAFIALAGCGKQQAPEQAPAPAAPVAAPGAQSPVAAPQRPAVAATDRTMPSGLENGDFEQAGTGDQIPGWSSSQHAGESAFDIRVDANGAYAGSGSLHVTRTKPNVYGALTQTLDAKPWLGKTVEVSAMMKTQGVGPKGWQLYINAGLPGTMRTAAALSGNTEWKRESVQVKVPQNARYLTIGATLRDGGDAWLDDVSLKALD